MSDESGNLTYTYDELSRLKSETKNFADTLSAAPSGGYVLAYTYHLNGGIKSMTDPFGNVVNYSSDRIGRINAVGNSGSSTAYVSTVSHRAFGAVKSMSLGATNPISVSLAYDSRLRPTSYGASSAGTTGPIQEAEYTYQNDDALGTIDNHAGASFSQANSYDFAGRLVSNEGEAYTQHISYDAFNNMTSRETQTYSLDPVDSFSTYSNNRKVSGTGSNGYDAAGRVTGTYGPGPDVSTLTWKFDAAGRKTRWEEYGPYNSFTMKGGETVFDGDGRAAKSSDITRYKTSGVWGSWFTDTFRYQLYSSVTGQMVTEVSSNGGHSQTSVYLGNSKIADERNGGLRFTLTDIVSGSSRETDADGAIPPYEESNQSRVELAGLGTSLPLSTPTSMPAPNYKKGGSLANPEGGCSIDGGPLIGPGMCGRILRAMGVQFIGNTLIVQTWREEHRFANAPGPRGQTLEWVAENYIGSDWRHIGTEIFEFPMMAGNVAWEKKALSSCVVKLLGGYFQDQLVDGRGVEIVADARFIKGIPAWASTAGNIGLTIAPKAITLGLYDIHFDGNSMNLDSPSWQDLRTIVEELQHGVQFIEMWQKLPMIRELEHPSGLKAPAHFPTYGEAQGQWQLNYALASADAWLSGRASYDNEFEAKAKQRRDDIMTDIQNKNASKFARDEKLCP